MSVIRSRRLIASIAISVALVVSELAPAAALPVERAVTPLAPTARGDLAGPHVHPPFPRATTACASDVLASLSPAQRVGQLFMLGIGASLGKSERKLIKGSHIGSVTFSAFVPSGTAGVRAVTDAVQALATRKVTRGVGFLVAANQEGGRVQALSGQGFSTMPTALAQGKLTPGRLKRRSHTWADELAAAGVNLDLAPVGDTVPKKWVSINAPIGQLQREFGRTPAVVEPHVRAFIEGMHGAEVLTTVKHFPGLGRVRGNTDFASGVHDTVTRPDDPFLRPFRVAVQAGVPFVMMSLASYKHLDGRTLAAFSKPITTGLLRGDMGFEGVVISDDLSAVAVQKMPAAQRAIRFLRAGGDMIIATHLRDARAMAKALVARAAGSASFQKRIDASVLRVLTAKESAGLLRCS